MLFSGEEENVCTSESQEFRSFWTAFHYIKSKLHSDLLLKCQPLTGKIQEFSKVSHNLLRFPFPNPEQLLLRC